LEKAVARQMVMARNKPGKDLIFVSVEGFRSPKDFDLWIKLALDFNPIAKATKKRK
jgi:hypothetical protein